MDWLLTQIKQSADKHGVPLATDYRGGMFGLFFTEAEQVDSFEQVMQCDIERFKAFFHGLLEAGVYMAPSAFEAGFISAEHGEQQLEQTAAAVDKVMATLV